MGNRSVRAGAALLAVGRAALGAAILAAPERVTSHWLGKENAGHPAVLALARGMAARDVGLGLAVLWTLDDPVTGPRMQAAAAFADASDAFATLIARRALPRSGAAGTIAVAGGSAAGGLLLARRLSHA